jgi:hypothetical protein
MREPKGLQIPGENRPSWTVTAVALSLGAKPTRSSLVRFNKDGTPRCARHFRVVVPKPILAIHCKETNIVDSNLQSTSLLKHLHSGNCPCTL